MKILSNRIILCWSILFSLLLFVSSCGSSTDELPDEITMPDGIEVISLELDEDEAGDLPSRGKTFSITVELNEPIPEGEWAIISFAVRDKELIGGMPVCVGFVGMVNSHGTKKTFSDRFELYCEDGKVAGQAIADLYDMDEWDGNSGEKSTKVYAQHIKGIKTFLGLTTGIEGVKSNRIKVECD